MPLNALICVHTYIYIYIYIERERDIYTTCLHFLNYLSVVLFRTCGSATSRWPGPDICMYRVCIYIYIYICIYIERERMSIYIYIYTHTHMYIYIYIPGGPGLLGLRGRAAAREARGLVTCFTGGPNER